MGKSVSLCFGCIKTLLFSHNSNPSQLQRAAEEAEEDEAGCGGWRRTPIEGIPAAVEIWQRVLR